jgi:hypothetical protein
LTEIPQHLLDRAKKRRGGGGAAADTADAPAAGAADAGPAEAAAPAEPEIDDRISGELVLTPLNGEGRTLDEWLMLFHLVVVVLDPYTNESSWILKTAGRALKHFDGAGARVGFVMTSDEEDSRYFLGPWANELLTFADPDRELVKALEIETLPALIHLKQDRNPAGIAQGWDPKEWDAIFKGLAKMMRWNAPLVPATGDPIAFEGSPALD